MIIYALFNALNKTIFMKDNWDLVPAVILQQRQGRAESWRPKSSRQREKRASRDASAARRAQWARTQDGLACFRQLTEESPKPRGGSGPPDPAHLPAKSVYFDQT